ncbi:hypothetical protein [Cyanobium sp. Morenito 9A2]|uniref:hypothetical protein n=1 Tax=Cyanobium sp. Morenito 9A2 TaxID=2823718 RepID=UPI0020CC7DE3|nr:hypothetical protein [Cyanobium sp. Morenito 9A2]MCP9849805.1 hypothetical protein [Cyanobium sp. Morenito 9A2]
MTYWITNGTYSYAGAGNAGTFSGWFNWDGTALSGGSLRVTGANPLGLTSPVTFTNVGYDPTSGNAPANSTSPIALYFWNEAGGGNEPGFRLALASPLATTPTNTSSTPISATAANSVFCTNFRDNNNNINSNQVSNNLNCPNASATALQGVSATVAAPAPLSWLGVGALLPMLFLRRRYVALLPNPADPRPRPGLTATAPPAR